MMTRSSAKCWLLNDTYCPDPRLDQRSTPVEQQALLNPKPSPYLNRAQTQLTYWSRTPAQTSLRGT